MWKEQSYLKELYPKKISEEQMVGGGGKDGEYWHVCDLKGMIQ